MSKIFITSDTFFGRESIIKKAKRPFANVDEMNQVIVDNWNSVVSEDDTVYHLGNFAWDLLSAKDALDSLNGTIVFLEGSYDDGLIEIYKAYSNIVFCGSAILKLKELKSVLCHWPLSDWPGRNRGSYHFHGSTLNKLKTDLKKVKNRINVCCDNWNFTPQRIDDLISLVEEFKKENEKA